MEKKPAADAASSTGRNPRPPHQAADPVTGSYPDTPRVSGAVLSHSQRVSPRKALPCSVLLYNGTAYVIARAIHDVSLVGAFVEIDTADLALGSIVDVVMEFSAGEHTVDLQLSAEIVRTDEQGVGLRFCAYGDQTYTDLVNLLYTH